MSSHQTPSTQSSSDLSFLVKTLDLYIKGLFLSGQVFGLGIY